MSPTKNMPSISTSHRGDQPTWRKRVLFRAGAICLAFAPLAVSECVLRLLDLGRVTEVTDPYVGFSEIHPLFELNSAGDRYEIATSRLMLFYPDSFAASKEPGEFRTFCLGGSTVQGSPYTIETSFTTWLELGLQAAAPDRRWDVVNCGGLSYASYRLVPILQEVLEYQPDLIILYTGHNEFLEDRSYEHVKRTPRLVAVTHAWCSRCRTYNLVRRSWLKLTAQLGNARGIAPTKLASDADALLDSPGGLAAYHRDDAWRRAAVQHYEFNLQRMVRMAGEAHVPILLVNPVCNLKDCPPFKFENRADLSKAQRAEFDRLWETAKSLPENRFYERIEWLERAIQIDSRHAGAHFLLGRCCLSARQIPAARQAFLRAKDEDLCPLRIIEPMHASIARVAAAQHTPLVDVRRLFEDRSPEEIPGSEWLIDHVHPTISGHQLIADALLREMMRLGMVRGRAGWEARREEFYRQHLASLETPYYARGKERLEGQLKWTQGRARKQVRAVAQ